jgi:hypothetical protein
MTDFPRLKTGAVLQYPAERSLRFPTYKFRFIDGTEQGFRVSAGPMRRWLIRLDLLDEAELSAIEQFFQDQQGSFGRFAFRDPADGEEYSDCSIDQNELLVQHDSEMIGSTVLVIRQNQ